MNKSDFYLIKEDFEHQAKTASFYDTLTNMCDIYPELSDMTVRDARNFLLDKTVLFEMKLMEAMSVEGIDSSPRNLSCGLSNDDMEQICKSLDRIKEKVTKKQKTMKEQNLAEEFRKILDNMSDEELNQKLKELEPFHNVGPKADDYLKFLEENLIDIAEILTSYPKGTKLYSPMCGECELDCVCYDDNVITVVYRGRDKSNYTASELYDELDRNYVLCFDRYGRYKTTDRSDTNGEVMLFPSKNCLDWDTMRVTQKAIIKGWVVVDKNSTGRRRVRFFPNEPVRDVLSEPYYYWAATPPYCESIRLDSSLFKGIE